MREKLRDKERLFHILDAIDTIQTKPVEYWEEAIENDPIAYFGVCKLIEIIGEATYKLSVNFRENYDHIPWDTIEGMRHVIVHDYYIISKRMLLQVIKKDLNPLKEQILEILKDLD